MSHCDLGHQEQRGEHSDEKFELLPEGAVRVDDIEPHFIGVLLVPTIFAVVDSPCERERVLLSGCRRVDDCVPASCAGPLQGHPPSVEIHLVLAEGRQSIAVQFLVKALHDLGELRDESGELGKLAHVLAGELTVRGAPEGL